MNQKRLHRMAALAALVVPIIACNFLTSQDSSPPTQTPPLQIQIASPTQAAPEPSDTPPPPSPTTEEPTAPPPSPTGPPIPEGTFQLLTPHEGSSTGEIRHLWVSPDGVLWIAGENGVFTYDEAGLNRVYDGASLRVQGMDDEGRIWVILDGETAIAAYSSSGGWSVYGEDQGWTTPPPHEYHSPGYGDGLVTDLQGKVWLATPRRTPGVHSPPPTSATTHRRRRDTRDTSSPTWRYPKTAWFGWEIALGWVKP
jgi:hypothetical protein